jgi:Ca2+/Na+ antiporter
VNKAAIVAGAVRAASGVSFLVAPERAQLLWSERRATDPTARLLLRSMGYRDTLIGGALLIAGARSSPNVSSWFLASAGADTADLIGGLAVRDELSHRDHVMGIGGAAVGVVIGLAGWAATRRGGRRIS